MATRSNFTTQISISYKQYAVHKNAAAKLYGYALLLWHYQNRVSSTRGIWDFIISYGIISWKFDFVKLAIIHLFSKKFHILTRQPQQK